MLPLVPLLYQDIVELAGLEERGDGPLDVAVIDGLVNDDAELPMIWEGVRRWLPSTAMLSTAGGPGS